MISSVAWLFPQQVVTWDTGGMERYGHRNVTPSYFAKSRAIILIYDTGNMETFNDLETWVKIAKFYCEDDAVLCLCGHNTNNDDNPVDESSVKTFASTYGVPPSLIFTVDPSTGDNMLECFKKTIEAVHLTVTQPRRAREELFGRMSVEETENSDATSTWCSKCGC